MTKKSTALTGRKFGKLTALEYVGKVGHDRQYPAWLCRCECGHQVTIPTYQLNQGIISSCPFCYENGAASAIWLKDQQILIFRFDELCKYSDPWHQIKKLRQNQSLDAILIPLDNTPSEIFKDCGPEVDTTELINEPISQDNLTNDNAQMSGLEPLVWDKELGEYVPAPKKDIE